VAVYERVASRAALIAKMYSVISSSSILQAELAYAVQPGCKQRVQAPDAWEVVFQVMMVVVEVVLVLVMRIVVKMMTCMYYVISIGCQHDAGHVVHGISSSANLEACQCISVIGSGSSSACSSVLWLLRAYMTRAADFAHGIASFTVTHFLLPSSYKNTFLESDVFADTWRRLR
jgi:hypothetical protein